MKAILKEPVYEPWNLWHKPKGTEVEVIETGLTRNALNYDDYKFYPVEQVKIKYPYFSIYFRDGREEIVYHTCEIDANLIIQS